VQQNASNKETDRQIQRQTDEKIDRQRHRGADKETNPSFNVGKSEYMLYNDSSQFLC